MRLINYDASEGDAKSIVVNRGFEDSLAIISTTGENETARLIEAGVVTFAAVFIHGFVLQAAPASSAYVEEALLAMSTAFNNSETPVFFARVVDSKTGGLIKTFDVSALSFTLYRYNVLNIRTGADAFEPVEGFSGLTLDVAAVWNDSPGIDDRCGFAPNIVWEPSTLEDNPFTVAGNYRAVFTITPVKGNRIPVLIEFKVGQ